MWFTLHLAALRTWPTQDSLRCKLFISAHNLSRIYTKRWQFSALLNSPTGQTGDSTWSSQNFHPFWPALSSFGFRVMASYNSLQAAFLPSGQWAPGNKKMVPGTFQLSEQTIIKSHLLLYLEQTNGQILPKTQSCYVPLRQNALLGEWLDSHNGAVCQL